jgi:hypothetical protein
MKFKVANTPGEVFRLEAKTIQAYLPQPTYSYQVHFPDIGYLKIYLLIVGPGSYD